jgi:hypothetical protein
MYQLVFLAASIQNSAPFVKKFFRILQFITRNHFCEISFLKNILHLTHRVLTDTVIMLAFGYLYFPPRWDSWLPILPSEMG